jgi:hypothetical protein
MLQTGAFPEARTLFAVTAEVNNMNAASDAVNYFLREGNKLLAAGFIAKDEFNAKLQSYRAQALKIFDKVRVHRKAAWCGNQFSSVGNM